MGILSGIRLAGRSMTRNATRTFLMMLGVMIGIASLTILYKEGRTIVLVTHDDAVAAYAAREIALRDGAIASDQVQEGKTVWES